MAAPHDQDVQLREKTIIRQEADRLFKEEYAIDVGSTVVPEKMKPPTAEATVSLLANMFPVKTHRQMAIYRWDVEILIDLRNGKKLSLTKKSESDAVAVDRKTKTRWVFKKMVEKYPQMFGKIESNYYDLESMLFTLKDIGAKGEDKLSLVVAGLDAELFQGSTSACVEIKKVTDKFEIDLTDFNHLTADIAGTDMSHKQFLEVVTNQYALMSNDFVCYPGGVSFDTRVNTTNLDEGKYLGHGVQKSVRYIEGAGGDKKPRAAIVFDLKKTAFHDHTLTGLQYFMRVAPNVARSIQNGQRIQSGNDFLQACKKMKGIRCFLTYANRRREMVIHDISIQTAHEMTFEIEGRGQKSVAQYFQDQYKIRLKFPNAPLAVEKKPGSKQLCYYPLECIQVVENQRVSGELPQSVIRDVIKHAAVVPADRQHQIMSACKNLRLSDNGYIHNVETTVEPQMMQLKGRDIKKPQMVYKKPDGRNAMVVAQNGKWMMDRGSKFFKPAQLRKWTVMMVTGERGAQQLMMDFIKKFMRECANRGMAVAEPEGPTVLQQNASTFQPSMEHYMRESFEDYKLDFVLCIQDKPIHEHKYLKYLERKYGLITQDITTATVRRCMGNAGATIENIVQKTNMKLGGLNFNLEMKNPAGTADVLSPWTMFVGLGMCHSKPPKPDATGKEPPRPASVVGFAANVLKDSFAFIGDYYYQAADRDERIFSIVPVVNRLLTQWCESHNNMMPKNIVFFRNGGSEGQFQLILKYEIPLIKHAIREFKENHGTPQPYETKFTVMIATKRHNVRFFKSNIRATDKAPQQNLSPGVAVDSTVTHPVFSEFFVNSHTTLQGTGKTPRYTVLYNDSNFSINQLEHYIYALSHGHQIVNLTTSLPTPAYIANDYAERGMTVLHQFLADNSGVSRDDYNTFNNELIFARMPGDHMFHHCRVNA